MRLFFAVIEAIIGYVPADGGGGVRMSLRRSEHDPFRVLCRELERGRDVNIIVHRGESTP